MNIRPYKTTDYDQIQPILQDGGHFDDVWDRQSHWDAKSKQTPESILVAERDGEILGCILIIRDKWTSFIFRLAVKKKYRSQGIGSELMKTAEKQLQQSGEDEVAIFVNEDDEALHEYYQKRGYLKGGKYRCLYKKLQ